MTNRERQREMRQRYMANELSHGEYYTWLGEFIGVNESMLPKTQEQIRRALAEGDEHLNNWGNRPWDYCDSMVRVRAYQTGLAWSLSDTVCTLKELARRVAEREDVTV